MQIRSAASNSLLMCPLVNCAAWLYCQTGMMKLGPAPSIRFFAMRLLPIVLCAGGALYFGNVAYMSLSVAFIQILKVSTEPHPLDCSSDVSQLRCSADECSPKAWPASQCTNDR